MSILDDAIREHLELKRAHGADEAELKKLEDEAFGPPQRPDELDASAEAPTEFLTAPSEVVEEAAAEIEGEGRRVPNIADLQEAPPAPQEAGPDEEHPDGDAEPSIEDQPAGEHQVISPEEAQQPVAEDPAPDPPTPDGVHTTEEREAIASQPTEMFDVQAEMDAGAPPEAESPSDEQLIDAAASEEPRLTPVEPPAVPEPDPDSLHDDDDDFFSEQRLSDELNQALEAPVEETAEHELPPLPEPPSEDPVDEAPAAPPTEEGTAIYNVEGEGEEYEEEDSGEHSVYEPETGSHDDVLEDTPDFLEDAPDADDAWFEQRPPKDFDFDD
jgi:hypothetical protein